jgi:hypothetical protein
MGHQLCSRCQVREQAGRPGSRAAPDSKLELMSTQQLLSRSHELAAWLEAQVHDLAVPASLRTRCSGACFVVAQEHHAAIALLLSQPLPIFASAFALVRPVYESLIRGLWLQHCATDEKVQAFSIGNRPPQVPDLLSAIKLTPVYSSGLLSVVYEQSWDAMCAYTHTGAQQIQRWNGSAAIQENYAEAEVCEVLRCTGSFALIALLGLAAVAANDSLAQRALAKMHEWVQ